MSQKMIRTAPFEHFPYDILRDIMLYTYVHILEPVYEEAKFDLRVLSPPISASHVCRSWRRALLSDPTMWSCFLIPKMKPDGIMELLRRSDSSLLNVFLELNDTRGLDHANTIEMLSSLFQQTHQFKVLRLMIAPHTYLYGPLLESLVQLVLSHLKRPTPNLETFSFWYNSLRDLSSNLNPNHEYLVTLFSGDAPNLKRIHHRLSADFQESICPPFHDLSELHLTLFSDINFDPFLDLLAGSPNLEILHVHIDGFSIISVQAVLESSSDRMIILPCLEKLVLEVNYTIELVSLVLKHITLPSNFKWYITFIQYFGFQQESPYLLQFLSRARFTSLHVRFSDLTTMLLQENQDTSNQSDENGLMHIYEDAANLAITGISFIRTLKSSCITHVEIELENSSEDNVIFTYALDMIPHLESLTARRMVVLYDDEWFLQWFIALVPNAPKVMAYFREMLEAQDPDLNLESIDLEGIVSASIIDPASGLFQVTAFPCPLLHKLTLEVKHTLGKRHVFTLIVCSVIRRKKGYPLQISIQCPRMGEGVEDKLKLSKNGDVKVLI